MFKQCSCLVFSAAAISGAISGVFSPVTNATSRVYQAASGSVVSVWRSIANLASVGWSKITRN